MLIPNSRLTHLFWLAMLGSSLSLGQIAEAQLRYITVDATASIDVKPDQIRFLVSLDGNGMTAKEAKESFDELKNKFNNVFDVMKFKGLSKKTVQRSISDNEYGVGFGGRFGGGPPPPEEEEQVFISELVEINIDGIDKLTEKQVDQMAMKYFTELKKLDLMPSSGFTASLKDETESKKKVLRKAMDQAKKQASTIADLSGGKIGRVLSVEQTEFSLFRTELADMLLKRIREAGYGGEFGGGIPPTIKISTKVRVKFELTD